jgi:hypothetical protein
VPREALPFVNNNPDADRIAGTRKLALHPPLEGEEKGTRSSVLLKRQYQCRLDSE